MIATADLVTVRTHNAVGFINVNNPPVNATSAAVRSGIVAAVAELNADVRVESIVLHCAGRSFIAGADISEFGKPRIPPSLAEVCDAIEASAKPVVAAIHGTALGGGFEIALACNARVAAADAEMGLPEVTLGLIPGAGGAARLARIVGAEEALKLVAGGKRIGTGRAEALGVVDRNAPAGTSPVDEAVALAAHLAGQAVRATRDRQSARPHDSKGFERLAGSILAKTKGQDAPAACVASVRRAMALPFEQAIAADRDAFAALSAGPQSRALRHAFFAERQAAKLDGADAAGQARPVRSVAILGAGTMGGGIAMSFAAAAIPVTLIDQDADSVVRGVERIRGHYAKSQERGSIEAAESGRRLALIGTATDRAAAADADLVIEAVFEDMALKQEIFADLDARCRPDAILATNTSALDVDAIAAALRRPDRLVGLHFFSPANVMKLVEIVRASATSPDTLATAIAVSKTIGKVSVMSGNCDGFIGNRMVAKRGSQVERLLQQGARPEQIDAALKSFGFPMGPLAINDMSGLDVGYSIRKRRGTSFPVADAIVERGWLGQKTGRGYYLYEAGSRAPSPNPDLAAVVADVSARLGVGQWQFSRDEMIERMIFSLINEGARILEEGIARRPSDIDVVWINGYGFPRWRGGPMFHADEVGLDLIVRRLRDFAADTDDQTLEPAPLLAALAAHGSTFRHWQADGMPRLA